LEDTRCQILVANDGSEALDFLNEGGVDLVLMDIQMPVMEGIEATRIIRANENEDEHLPIIAMTAGAMTTDRENVFEAGMDAHITKPVGPEELYAELAKWRRKIT